MMRSEKSVALMDEKIRGILREKKAIGFAYLFGSYSTGTTHRDSDVDIAVHLTEREKLKDSLRWRLRLMAEISSELRMNDVDVVVLNEAPLVLRYEIVSSGKIIVNTVPGSELEFRLRTMKEYFDTAPMRDMFRRVMKKKIREGTYLGQP